MNEDMTVSCGDGYINIRVGAIIMKNGRFFMAGNDSSEYLYSIGGRIKFGETAEEAVIREVREETGTEMEIDRLGFIHENYFKGDAAHTAGKHVYEISFYFYMKTPDGFEAEGCSFTENGTREFLRWVRPDEDILYYPGFFRTELAHPVHEIRHFITDDR